MRSSRSLLVVLLAALALMVPACNPTAGPPGTNNAPGGTKRFILLTNGNSPFWDACRFGLQQGAIDFQLAEIGIAVVMEVNDGTPQGQIEKLRQFGSQSDIVGVAVSALDADNAAVVDAMSMLRDKGVHVITVDADVNRQRFRDARPFYIGTDNIVGGRALGTAAKQLLEARSLDRGSYVQFVGRTGSDNARKRMDGFREAIGQAYREADRMGDDMDLSRARENVRNAINNHNDLVSLVGIWSYNAPAIVDIVKEYNNRDKFTIVTFDAEPGAIKEMGQNQIDAMVVQDPFDMGYQAVRLLKAMYENDEATIVELFPNQGQENGDIYNTGLRVVVPDADSPLRADMFDPQTVEFMTLSQFKEWLDKYGLKGS